MVNILQCPAGSIKFLSDLILLIFHVKHVAGWAEVTALTFSAFCSKHRGSLEDSSSGCGVQKVSEHMVERARWDQR